jgi:preprotein translocase subunit SecB
MPNETTSSKEFAIQQIYVKDASYEAPNTPDVFREQWSSPDVNVDLDIETHKLEDNVHEVALRITVNAKRGDKTLFISEVKQAGIFFLKGFSEQELDPVLKANCPAILLPYAREEISSRIAKGGFPAVYLAPIDFDYLYMQKRDAAQGAGEQGKVTVH